MFLEVFDLQHDLISVLFLLVRQNVKLVLGVLLHEYVVLVQNLDSLVDLEDFPRLHVFEVNLPLGCFLVQRVHLALQICHLMFEVLLQGAHDFLNPGDLLHQSFISHPSMLNRLLLQRIYLADVVFKSGFEELLSFADRIRDLTHFLDRLFYVLLRLFTDQLVLHLLLVTHLFDKIGHLLHRRLHLGHDTFLSI